MNNGSTMNRQNNVWSNREKGEFQGYKPTGSYRGQGPTGASRSIRFSGTSSGSQDYQGGSGYQGNKPYQDNSGYQDNDNYHYQGNMGRNSSGKSRSNYRKKPFRGGRGGYQGQRHGEAGPRSHIEDDDADMGDTGASSHPPKRFTPYGSSRGHRQDRYGGRQAVMDGRNVHVTKRIGDSGGRDGGARVGGGNYPLAGGPDAWFRVQIPFGKKQDRAWLLQALLNATQYPFTPVNYHFESQASVFHVQDSRCADALKQISRTVETPDKHRMVILVYKSRAPQQDMTEDVLEKLKVVMSSRYDPTTKVLNLAAFHKDDTLKAAGLHLPIKLRMVAKEVMGIIYENIPELEALDLQENGLGTLSMMSEIAEKAPCLKRVNLGKNMLTHDAELRAFTKVDVEELWLDGNPLCDKFKDEQSYVAAIRKKFPKVLKLDGHDLPPPITFDVETKELLPTDKGSFLGSNENAKNLVLQFLKQFFTLYDSGDRQPLFEAYHDDAQFSLTSYVNNVVQGTQPSVKDYLLESRNLLRVPDSQRRSKLLRQGRLKVVAFLSGLPDTEHDLNSLTVDIIHLAPTFLIFSASGLFKETHPTDTKKINTRSFSRLFVTVPQGAGIAITNEELVLTNATIDQRKKGFKTPKAPAADAGPAAAPAPAPASLTPEQKQQLVQQFVMQSGMNANWSTKCLEENAWDYTLGANMFSDLRAKGSIPPEAFTS